jgi:superfamily II DNA/RNA helicase
MTGIGRHFKVRGELERVATNELRRYTLRTDDHVIDDLARYMAAAYIPRNTAAALADSPVAPMLPTDERYRMGDFGEILTRALYIDLLGYEVPFQKLSGRPAANVTTQGPDTLAVLCSPIGAATPVVVEVKATKGRATAGFRRKDIRKELENVENLDASWIFAVEQLGNMPEPERLRAFHLAKALASKATDTPFNLQPTARHVSMVCGDDGVDGDDYWAEWSSEWGHSQLHIIEVPDLSEVVTTIYKRAAQLTFRAVVSLDITALLPPGVTVRQALGNAAPLRRSVQADLSSASSSRPLQLIAESACWFLSNQDGVGQAAAREATEDGHATTVERCLAHVLLGDIDRAQELWGTGSESAIGVFLSEIGNAWTLPASGDERLDAAARAIEAEGLQTDVVVSAVLLVAAAVMWRLPRHPKRFVGPSPKPAQAAVLRYFELNRQRAMWPGQAKVLDAGLLDVGRAGFAVEMPTSAGKTALMMMTIAATLDASEDSLVVVLSPTRALVGQHTEDFRAAFDHFVVGLNGGDDVDLTDQNLGQSVRLAVMTPERLDVELRRSDADSAGIIDRLALVIVDEAHMLVLPGRGARLELLLSRLVARGGIRVMLFTSQLGDPEDIIAWLRLGSAATVRSEWRPSPLRRGVMYPDGDTACIKWEHSENPEICLQLVASLPKKGAQESLWQDVPEFPQSGRRKNQQIGALAWSMAEQGMVMVFAAQTQSVITLARSVLEAQQASLFEAPSLDYYADGILAVSTEQAALLRSGIGIHYRGLHGSVQQASIDAAKAGLLRVIVCTSTLADGINLPLRTVIIANRQLGPRESLAMPVLNNLAGRAGRGGNLRSGTVINYEPSRKKALSFEETLLGFAPATQSTLQQIFHSLRSAATTLLTDTGVADRRWVIPDEVLFEALTEETLDDDRLRAQIEAVLRRTLWGVSQPGALPDFVMQPLLHRGHWMQRNFPDRSLLRAFRRVGLPLLISQSIFDKLSAASPDEMLAGLASDPMQRLRLLRTVIDVAHEADDLEGLDPDTVQEIVLAWVSGEPELALMNRPGVKWNPITKILDNTLPWYLSGAVEILGLVTHGDRSRIDEAHREFGATRVRYGAPDIEVCRLIRAGVTRETALRLHSDFLCAADEEDELAPFSLHSFWMYMQLYGYRDLTAEQCRQLGLRVPDEGEEV